MSHYIFNNEPVHLLQWATTSLTINHNIIFNEPLNLIQWTTTAPTMSHNIFFNEPQYLQRPTMIHPQKPQHLYNEPPQILTAAGTLPIDDNIIKIASISYKPYNNGPPWTWYNLILPVLIWRYIKWKVMPGSQAIISDLIYNITTP